MVLAAVTTPYKAVAEGWTVAAQGALPLIVAVSFSSQNLERGLRCYELWRQSTQENRSTQTGRIPALPCWTVRGVGAAGSRECGLQRQLRRSSGHTLNRSVGL